MMQQITNELGATNGGPILSLIPGGPVFRAVRSGSRAVRPNLCGLPRCLRGYRGAYR